MLAAVNFNNDPALKTYEIENIVSEWDLAAEFCPGESTAAKQMPHRHFGIGCASPHISSVIADALCNWSVMIGGHNPSPGPAFGRATLSHKGRG